MNYEIRCTVTCWRNEDFEADSEEEAMRKADEYFDHLEISAFHEDDPEYEVLTTGSPERPAK